MCFPLYPACALLFFRSLFAIIISFLNQKYAQLFCRRYILSDGVQLGLAQTILTSRWCWQGKLYMLPEWNWMPLVCYVCINTIVITHVHESKRVCKVFILSVTLFFQDLHCHVSWSLGFCFFTQCIIWFDGEALGCGFWESSLLFEWT